MPGDPLDVPLGMVDSRFVCDVEGCKASVPFGWSLDEPALAFIEGGGDVSGRRKVSYGPYLVLEPGNSDEWHCFSI